MSDTSWHNIYQLQMHNILQVASISIAAENVHFTELRLLLSELCVKSNSALWSAVLTNITEVHETVLADIHARSLLWQFYFHMHWTIFCTNAKYKYLCHNILHVMYSHFWLVKCCYWVSSALYSQQHTHTDHHYVKFVQSNPNENNTEASAV